jgi:hypothetical protein
LEENELQIKEVTPIALQTRSCRQSINSTRIEEDKGDNEKDTNQDDRGHY